MVHIEPSSARLRLERLRPDPWSGGGRPAYRLCGLGAAGTGCPGQRILQVTGATTSMAHRVEITIEQQ